MSNHCEGLPNGICPDNRCDKTVMFGIYDLFMCPACEKNRDAERSKGPEELKEVAKKASKQSAKKPAGSNTATLSSNTTVAACQATPKNTSSDVIGVDASTDGASSASSTAVAVSSGSSQQPEYVVNELLTYVCFYCS